jgi:hypothetical protein
MCAHPSIHPSTPPSPTSRCLTLRNQDDITYRTGKRRTNCLTDSPSPSRRLQRFLGGLRPTTPHHITRIHTDPTHICCTPCRHANTRRAPRLDPLDPPARPLARSSTQCDATCHASANQDRTTVPVLRIQTEYTYLPCPALTWPALPDPAQHSTAPASTFRDLQRKHVRHSANTNTRTEHSSPRRAGAQGNLQRAGRGEPEGAAQPSREREEERRQGLLFYFGTLQRYAPGLDWDFAVAWAWRRAGGRENEVGG